MATSRKLKGSDGTNLIERTYKNGDIKVFYQVGGGGAQVLHNPDGPAWIFTDKHTSRVYCKYYSHGQIHRKNGPAVTIVGEDWYKEYWIEGLRHRTRGPAVIHGDHKEWYVNGELHREGKPAIIHHDGDEEWYLNGKLHREDGPAEIEGISRKWYKEGELHRVDGPAVYDVPDGDLLKSAKKSISKLKDILTNPKYSYIDKLKRLDKLSGDDELSDLKNECAYYDGDVEYYLEGKLHRIDGPAILKSNGEEWWYKNGVEHRTDGPAYICKDRKEMMYYLEGKLHREDGPAHITDSMEIWYKNGLKHRTDGPADIDTDTNIGVYYFEGKRHREDGPAVIRITEIEDRDDEVYNDEKEFNSVVKVMIGKIEAITKAGPHMRSILARELEDDIQAAENMSWTTRSYIEDEESHEGEDKIGDFYWMGQKLNEAEYTAAQLGLDGLV